MLHGLKVKTYAANEARKPEIDVFLAETKRNLPDLVLTTLTECGVHESGGFIRTQHRCQEQGEVFPSPFLIEITGFESPVGRFNHERLQERLERVASLVREKVASRLGIDVTVTLYISYGIAVVA
jgi:hypothetical protein